MGSVISSKTQLSFQASAASINADTASYQHAKKCRRTDGQTAFQLYIVDKVIKDFKHNYQ